MPVDLGPSTRPANPGDRNALLTLIRFEDRVHSHLDWRPIEEWLGAQPFLLAERRRRAVAALACPPDPPDTAWLRLFAVAEGLPLIQTWRLLWDQAHALLRQGSARRLAALCLEAWMADLCRETGFDHVDDVAVLSRSARTLAPGAESAVRVRRALPEDYAAIIAADLAAFGPPWQMSPDLIRSAIPRASLLTVAEMEGEIAGYQLSTPSAYGAHLARLAVLPAWQGQGVGTALVRHLIEHFARGNARTITVNTQASNAASLHLYRRLGFELTGERFPVFICALPEI
jgi:ribosomal-protein-alanine N-acetyltransferase